MTLNIPQRLMCLRFSPYSVVHKDGSAFERRGLGRGHKVLEGERVHWVLTFQPLGSVSTMR